jgi:hypothetical protein
VFFGGLASALLLVGMSCPKPMPNDFSYVLIDTGSQIPGDWVNAAAFGGDYHHIYTCPGDQIVVWWNDKGVTPAAVTPIGNNLNQNDVRTLTVPPSVGDTVYHMVEGQDFYPGSQDAINTVAGPNGGAFATVSANSISVDTTTGLPAYQAKLFSPIFSKGLHVKSITILESPGVGNANWTQGSMQDEANNTYTFPPLTTQHTLDLPPGNQPPLRGYWYFAPDKVLNPQNGSILIKFEIFCK